jgi:DNA-directed RNA polymerase specialized sigma24 family protein
VARGRRSWNAPPAPHEGPEVEVDLADFRKAIEAELDRFTKHLSDVKREIIRLSFFERKTPQEIHELLGVSVAKCKEVPRLWLRHLAQRYPVTLDFLSDAPPPP